MNDKYFDQILGIQKDLTTERVQKLTKNFLDAYIKELPKKIWQRIKESVSNWK